MNEVLKWIGGVAAIWFAASLLAGAAWALLRNVTRTDADRVREEEADLLAVVEITKQRAENELLNSLIREAHQQAQEDRGYAKHGIEQLEQYVNAGDR